MKKQNLFKSLFAGLAIATLALGLTSCKKNDVDDEGTANVKVVNASASANGQAFAVANNVLIQGGLDFGGSSAYITANSGNNLELKFVTAGSGATFASSRYNFDKGAYYTVFLAGDGQSARVKTFKDDVSVVSGKARVRFVHLSDAAPANIDIRNGATTNVVVNLGRDNASNYVEIDPGIASYQIFATGQTTSLGTFDLTAFAAGKVYTVYVTGATSNTITVRQIAHN